MNRGRSTIPEPTITQWLLDADPALVGRIVCARHAVAEDDIEWNSETLYEPNPDLLRNP